MSGKKLSYITGLTYVLMVVVNALANILPINGIGTGQVSDNYGNLFAPSGYVFAIWGVIYLLLAMYVFYQFNLFKRRPDMTDRVILRVNRFFIWSSLFNTLWIFAWHYDLILVSMFLMIGILLTLIQARITITHRSTLTNEENNSLRIPFSIYLAWITIATIANFSTYLVSVGWDGFGISESIWTVIMLSIGTLLVCVMMVRLRDTAFGVVFIWAYIGILVKHLSPDGFKGVYLNVIITVIGSLVIILLFGLATLVKNKKRGRKERGSNNTMYGVGSKSFESNEYYDDFEK